MPAEKFSWHESVRMRRSPESAICCFVPCATLSRGWVFTLSAWAICRNYVRPHCDELMCNGVFRGFWNGSKGLEVPYPFADRTCADAPGWQSGAVPIDALLGADDRPQCGGRVSPNVTDGSQIRTAARRTLAKEFSSGR